MLYLLGLELIIGMGGGGAKVFFNMERWTSNLDIMRNTIFFYKNSASQFYTFYNKSIQCTGVLEIIIL